MRLPADFSFLVSLFRPTFLPSPSGIAVETSSKTEYGQIVAGRVLTGYGVGALSGLVPVYQAEASPPHLRGVVTGSFQGCVTLVSIPSYSYETSLQEL